MNGIFLPMFIQGLAGVNRRLYDGGRTYTRARRASRQLYSRPVVVGGVPRRRAAVLHRESCSGASGEGAHGSDNPWDVDDARVDDDVAAAARQLRDDADGRVAGRTTTACRARRATSCRRSAAMIIPYTIERRADTGVTTSRSGIWLFLASEVMLFGALFSAYALLRVSAPAWPSGRDVLSLPLGATNTVILLAMTDVGLASAIGRRARRRDGSLGVELAAGAGVSRREVVRVARRDRPRACCRRSARFWRCTSR